VKPVVVNPEAEIELVEAAKYYEDQARGLGGVFAIAVEAMIVEIESNPGQFSKVGISVRRAVMERFPYSIIFSVEPDCLRVLAIAHQKRRPNCWKGRKTP